VNTSLFDKREHIEKLHRTCNLLRKVQVLKQLFISLTLFTLCLCFRISNVMQVRFLLNGANNESITCFCVVPCCLHDSFKFSVFVND
jgi:hypothetical protein